MYETIQSLCTHSHAQMRTCAYVHQPCTHAHAPKCTQECIKSVFYIDKRTHACKSKRKNYESDKRCSLKKIGCLKRLKIGTFTN